MQHYGGGGYHHGYGGRGRGGYYGRGRGYGHGARGRGRGYGGRGGGRGRGRGRGRGGNNRDKSKRAPLEDASNKLMKAIEKSENTKSKADIDGNDINWMNNIVLRSKQQNNTLINENNNKPLQVTTNTYPIEFHNELIIGEYIVIDPNKHKTNNRLCNANMWAKIYKNKENVRRLKQRFAINYRDDDCMTIYTVHFDEKYNYKRKQLLKSNDENTNTNTNNKQREASQSPESEEKTEEEQDIIIEIDDIQFILEQKQQFHVSTFCNTDNINVAQTRILQKMVHHFFTKQQYKKQEQAYFERNAGMNHIQSIGNDISYMEGFKASIVHIIKKPYLGIKIWSKFIFLEQTVRDQLKYGKNNDSIINQRAMVMYSMATIQIKDIDNSQNENDGFEQNGKHISYKDYVSQHYDIDKYYIKDEKYGLVIDKKGNRYLPQYLRIIIDNRTERAKSNGKKLNLMVNERIKTRAELVQKVAKQNGNSNKQKRIFDIDTHPISTKGFILSDPEIEMNIHGKNTIIKTSEIQRNWKYLSGTMDSKIHSKHRYSKWSIYIHDKTNVNHSNYENINPKVNKLRNAIGLYINKRSFVPFFHSNIDEIRNLNDIFDKHNNNNNNKIDIKRSILLCIIASGVHGSQHKRTLHEKCLEYGIITQFMEETNIYTNIKVFGAMDDCMFKINESLYAIKSSQTYHNNLLLGFDVNHCTNRNIIRPSIGVMTGIRKYYIPKQNRINGCVSLLKKGQEQPSRELAKEMAKNILISQLSKTKELPHVIWYFRDGISESQFQQLTFAEIKGLKEAINEVKHNEKLLKYFREDVLNKWTPKMEIVVIQKRISDKFYSSEGHRLSRNANTYIVPHDVVHRSFLDLYIKKGDHHPLRIVFMVDELQFAKNGKIMEACQFLLDLLYCFPYGMPLGACAIPSPIKWSDKWAQTYQELIDSEKHKSIEDVSRFLNLAYIKPSADICESDNNNENTTSDNRERRKRSASRDKIELRSRSRSRDRKRDKNKNRKRSHSSVSSNKEHRHHKKDRHHRYKDKHRERRKDRHKHKSRSRSRSRHRQDRRQRSSSYGKSWS